MNQFLNALRSHDTYTENGAVSHSTTGKGLLDYFSNCGTYRDRDINLVNADISKMWAESPFITMQMLMYLRNVTRTTHALTENVTKGQGARDEFRKAIGWVAKYHPETFRKNMWLIPHVGCWKDLWHEDMASLVPQDKLIELIIEGINDEYHRTLLAKYLPKIRSSSNTHNAEHRRKNALARAVCAAMSWTERDYRRFKSSGESHAFQRAMSNRRWADLDFSRVPGKALFQLANHKGRDGKTFLERHGLEQRYVGWLAKQPSARFTGYVYELYDSICGSYRIKPLSLAQKMTVDKQFEGLLELARKDRGGIQGNVWCAIDTSGSMGCRVAGGATTAINACVSMGIYFSSLNEGAFKNHIMMFDDHSSVMELKGTFVDKAIQIRSHATAWGSTNFQSVIDEIVRIRRSNPNIPIEDFPTTLLVVSDMQFDPSGSNETNYETAMRKLRAVGLPNIKVIWWDVTGRKEDYPSKASDAGTVLIGGFDGSVVTTILGGETKTIDKTTGKVRELNAYENMLKALDQDVFNLVQI